MGSPWLSIFLQARKGTATTNGYHGVTPTSIVRTGWLIGVEGWAFDCTEPRQFRRSSYLPWEFRMLVAVSVIGF